MYVPRQPYGEGTRQSLRFLKHEGKPGAPTSKRDTAVSVLEQQFRISVTAGDGVWGCLHASFSYLASTCKFFFFFGQKCLLSLLSYNSLPK